MKQMRPLNPKAQPIKTNRRIFRENVPEELVMEFFAFIGVKEKQDCKWFSKEVFTEEVIEKVNDLLPVLEPYYYPHKSFLLTRQMGQIGYVQIYKQLASCIDCVLERRESKGREVYKRKTTLYRLALLQPLPNATSFTVYFN